MPFPSELVSKETPMVACYAGHHNGENDVIWLTPHVPAGYEPEEADEFIDKRSSVALDTALLRSVGFN